MGRRSRSIVGYVLVAILFASAVVLANHHLRGRNLDLTENRLYTLSDGARQAIAELKEPVTFRFFYSESLAPKVAGIGAYADRVRDMLREFAALANGNIRIETIDPLPFTEDEDRAVAAGVSGASIGDGETLYFGLVAENLADGREVIPYFDPSRENLLEYDLTRIVVALGRANKPRVAVLTGLPMEYGPGGIMAAMQGQAQPYAIYSELQRNFDLVKLDQDSADIPDDVAALFLIQPPPLSAATLYAIDQYVMRGGRVAAFLDPYAEVVAAYAAASRGQGPQPQITADVANLEPLLKSWGVAIDVNQLVADSRRALRVSTPAAGRREVVDYVAWISLTAEDANADDPIVADLTNVNFASAGAVASREGSSLVMTPLLQTTKASMLIAPSRVQGRVDPDALLRDFQASGERYALTARFDGETASAFPDGPPEGVSAPEGREHLAKSEKPTAIVVTADADVLEDQFWVQYQQIGQQRVGSPRADNYALVLNAADSFIGGPALMGLRTRGESRRPFTVVEELRRAAEQRYLVEEQNLQAKVRDAETRIRALRTAGVAAGEGAVATADAGAAGNADAAEREELLRFTEELLKSRAELRQVQAGLRADVDQLERNVMWANIGLAPLVVGVAALVAAWLRARRRRRARVVRHA